MPILYINGGVTKIWWFEGAVFFKLYFDNYSFLDILYEFERKITGPVFFLNLILVVLHHFMFCWPRPYIFVIVLLSLSKHINLLSLSKHINLPLNHLIIVLKKKITIASPKTLVYIYHNPFVRLKFCRLHV